MIVYNRLVPFGKYQAMAIWPFIFSKSRLVSDRRKNHERIHLRQQLEVMLASAAVLAVLCMTLVSWWWMTAAPAVYYLLYAADYAVRLAVCRDRDEAYLGIVFEQEAVANELDFRYLEHRRPFAWLGYAGRRARTIQ